MSKIAFIGLGNMGGPMAINLAKAGHEVSAFDLSVEARELVAGDGIILTDTTRETVTGAEILITMLPAGSHVENVLIKEDALFDHLPTGSLVIDCSTIDVETTQKIGRQASERGLSFVDAPVSGGTAGAKAGTLTFMIGGEESDFKNAKKILECMGSKTLHAGPPAAGQITKACNNMMLAISMAGTAEALNMGINNGLDPRVLSEIMKASSGDSWVLQQYNPVPGVMEKVPASCNYQGGFFVDLMSKDLSLAMALSQLSDSIVPLGSLVNNLFNLHRQQGHGRLDFSSIIKLVSGRKITENKTQAV